MGSRGNQPGEILELKMLLGEFKSIFDKYQLNFAPITSLFLSPRRFPWRILRRLELPSGHVHRRWPGDDATAYDRVTWLVVATSVAKVLWIDENNWHAVTYFCGHVTDDGLCSPSALYVSVLRRDDVKTPIGRNSLDRLSVALRTACLEPGDLQIYDQRGWFFSVKFCRRVVAKFARLSGGV